MQRILAIINPSSGARQGAQIAQWLSEIAVNRGLQLTIRPTVSHHSAAELVCDANEFSRVVVAGGDGTVTEVLNGLVGTNVPLAIIPGGTGNVLGQAIGVNPDLREEEQQKQLEEKEAAFLDLILRAYRAEKIEEILKVNRKGEKEAIDFYKRIYKKIVENKDQLVYEFETLEHELRHIILDEQEHAVELTVLLGD